MKKTNNKTLTAKQKKELTYVIMFLSISLWTLFEFKFQDFSPFQQIQKTVLLPSILIIGIVLLILLRKKIFNRNTNVSIAGQGIVILILSAVASIPILGLSSLTNRKIGIQEEYCLKGKIISLDSIPISNSSTGVNYSIEIIEKNTNRKLDFNISENEYLRFKEKDSIEKVVTKGYWGFLYKE